MRTRLFKFYSGMFMLPFVFFSYAVSQNVLVGAYSDYGLQGGGTTFSVLTSGANFNVDHTFTNRGERPMGQLVKGTDGNFYGMTNVGGVTKQGTIFKITPGGVVS